MHDELDKLDVIECQANTCGGSARGRDMSKVTVIEGEAIEFPYDVDEM